ncbi:hypothetical protein FOIG_11961 [Fusarium odoratissimum NRRL 54006]|uniref:Uncharacterized protein n=2 Tax=Fusarium oxysporum species complex TaxID=171631 RepID=X0JGC5_FUSO5|nr:uncharacterized protein FOIG_11961 [Fusarium odoratissimum NRRL 54006]EXL95446.1 hypothetical protein FOIG_11961 [Fusarium odoratissimum NRRL 54006]TXC06116.1 hypothetical protein FocTR4_00010610 [Fusarium oxysporum f. sp. cubense]
MSGGSSAPAPFGSPWPFTEPPKPFPCASGSFRSRSRFGKKRKRKGRHLHSSASRPLFTKIRFRPDLVLHVVQKRPHAPRSLSAPGSRRAGRNTRAGRRSGFPGSRGGGQSCSVGS